MSKFSALSRHLSVRKEQRVQMGFAEVEAILGFDLPASARSHRPWWANTEHGHVQSRGWMEAGFRTEQVELDSERLVFVRVKPVEAGEPPVEAGRHPLLGAMAGTVTLSEGTSVPPTTWANRILERITGRRA
jgi:hypothetical protein